MWPGDEQEFPASDLQASREDAALQTREAAAVEAASRRSGVTCPDCGDPSSLAWFYFESPDWTWDWLCGRAGVIAYCDVHEQQVAFFLERLN